VPASVAGAVGIGRPAACAASFSNIYTSIASARRTCNGLGDEPANLGMRGSSAG
jgi:hypothetical protein